MTPTSRHRLLVVAPHASRSGSTKVLIELVARATAASGLAVAVELLAGGPMQAELEALGAPAQPGDAPDAVLINSALAAGVALDHLGRSPVAVYLHESGEVLATLPERDAEGLRSAQVVLCVSDRIGDDAVAFGVERERIVVLPPIIVPAEAPPPEAVLEARAAMGAGPGELLVVGCAEARWGKGPDLFIDLARELGVEGMRYAWLGLRQRALGRQLDHDVRWAGLAGRLRWMGSVAQPLRHLAAADVLVVPSRDDPQPLVPLEAAQVGVPTVAFAVGGLAELGQAGAALVADYPDISALAEQVRRCCAAPALRRALVAAALDRIAERQAPEVVVPRFLDVIERLLDEER